MSNLKLFARAFAQDFSWTRFGKHGTEAPGRHIEYDEFQPHGGGLMLSRAMSASDFRDFAQGVISWGKRAGMKWRSAKGSGKIGAGTLAGHGLSMTLKRVPNGAQITIKSTTQAEETRLTELLAEMRGGDKQDLSLDEMTKLIATTLMNTPGTHFTKATPASGWATAVWAWEGVAPSRAKTIYNKVVKKVHLALKSAGMNPKVLPSHGDLLDDGQASTRFNVKGGSVHVTVEENEDGSKFDFAVAVSDR